MFPGGNIVRITPTISATAYDAADVLFLTTEIPNAVSNRGGVSKLVAITALSQHDATDDIRLIFMENSYDLIGALSPGSSGGVAMTDANAEAANLLGSVLIDGSFNIMDLGGARLWSGGGAFGSGSGLSMPMMLQAAPGSTSVYVAGIAVDAQDYAAVDDLDLAFHIEYLD
jgi:hypothetical protein